MSFLMTKETYMLRLTECINSSTYKGDFIYVLNGAHHVKREKTIVLVERKQIEDFKKAYKNQNYILTNGTYNKETKTYTPSLAEIADEVVFSSRENLGLSHKIYGYTFDRIHYNLKEVNFVSPLYVKRGFYLLYVPRNTKKDAATCFCAIPLNENKFEVLSKIEVGTPYTTYKVKMNYNFSEKEMIMKSSEALVVGESYVGYFHRSKPGISSLMCEKAFCIASAKIEIQSAGSVIHDIKTLYTNATIKFLKYTPGAPEVEEPRMEGYFLNIFKGDVFSVKGYWLKKERYTVFRVIEKERVFSDSEGILKEYLNLHMSKAVATKMIKAYGPLAVEKAKESHENFISLGIKEKKAIELHQKVVSAAYQEELFEFFLMYNFESRLIKKIVNTYSLDGKAKIIENPYRLCEDIGFSFKDADILAQSLGIQQSDQRRVCEAVHSYIKSETESAGHLFVYKKALLTNLNRFVEKAGCYKTSSLTENDIEMALESLRAGEKPRIYEVKHETNNEICIYLGYYNYVENQIVKKIEEMIHTFKNPFCSKEEVINFIDSYELNYSFKFAQKQKEAIEMAMTEGFSILTGGPGTGKTQTVNSIIKCLKTIKPSASIVLLAPTGKAGKRMSELTNLPASTIHRRLGFLPFEDAEEEFEEIVEDFVVVDEASMIDADLFLRLIRSLSSSSKLLLVGDVNQIPSVGPGLILKELIESNQIPVVVLNEIFRQSQDSRIVSNAYRVIKGETELDMSEDSDFEMIECENPQFIQEQILMAIEKEINNGTPFSNIQVLSPYNKGDLGVFELNRLIQERFNPKKDTEEEYEYSPVRKFRKRDRVIQIKNDYDLGVFNGTTGEISNVNVNGEINVDIDGDDIVYSDEQIDMLLLGYAITIHKSQGSEFPVVIMPIHRSQRLLNNKNLLYTGITRARKKVILVGEVECLKEVILKEDATIRNSQILEKMEKEFSKNKTY